MLQKSKIANISYGVVTEGFNDNSGDGYVVKQFEDKVFFIICDSLGHGLPAFKVTQKAISFINSLDELSIGRLTFQLDKILQKTRGMVISILQINLQDQTLLYQGIGDITTSVFYKKSKTHKILISKNGIVGCNLPTSFIQKISIGNGDRIFITTDGIDEKFYHDFENQVYEGTIIELIENIFQNHRKVHDDALVMGIEIEGF